MEWSEDARIALSPRATYRELSSSEGASDQAWVTATRVGRLLLVIGAFVAFSTAGRLAPFHVAATMFFWSFVPLLQAIAVCAAIASVRARGPLRALALYFTGHGPWMIALLLISGACIFAPDPSVFVRTTGGRIALVLVLVVPLVWSVVLTTHCFVHGLALGRRRGAIATCAFYLTYVGLLVAWYVGVGQVQTLIWATR